jgi:hypothetical protein
MERKKKNIEVLQVLHRSADFKLKPQKGTLLLNDASSVTS